MISNCFISTATEFSNFYDSIRIDQNFIYFKEFDFFFNFLTTVDSNFLQIIHSPSSNANIIIKFINQIEDIDLYNNVENITTVYHYSIPNTKLYYPEPFIAAPSFMHSDLWFVHILVYQYWLWFVFVFIIVFFFITFICTLRWCNMRVRPRRETRGVSRSKCGDLITACVPVTWATSIIVNESTDAIDFYDGFGTTELVVGIRAYQWGWEYYYPKDIDLNYNIKSNYSAFIGNSLKYNRTSDLNIKANNLWKFYQNKTTDQVVTPAHVLALPLDNYKLFNFLSFNDLGSNSNQELNSFKRARMFSKTLTTDLFFVPNDFSIKYKTFINLFLDSTNFADSYLYGIKRQHNFLSLNATLNNQSTLLNLSSVNKLTSFNFKNNLNFDHKVNQLKLLNFLRKPSNGSGTELTFRLNKLFNQSAFSEGISLNNFSSYSNLLSLLNDNTDKKKIQLPVFKLFNLKFNKKNLFNFKNLNKLNSSGDLSILDKNLETDNFFFNNNLSGKQYLPFSSNLLIRISDRFSRNCLNTSPNTANFNFSTEFNSLNNYLNLSNKSFGVHNDFFYKTSLSKWAELSTTVKLISSKLNTEYPYPAITSNHPAPTFQSYDDFKFNDDPESEIASILSGREELIAPAIMNAYWHFTWYNSNFNWRIYSNHGYHNDHKFFYIPTFSFYYDYDFKNWQVLQFLEDSIWESICSAYTQDEYVNLSENFYSSDYFDKWGDFFITMNKFLIFQDGCAEKPFFKDTSVNEDYFSSPLYLEDFSNNLATVALKDFTIYPLFSVFAHMEESYESFKSINHLFNLNNKIFLLSSNFGFQPHHYSFVFDMFRADTEEFQWFLDENNIEKIFFTNIYNNVTGNNFSKFWFNLVKSEYLNFFINNKDFVFFISFWLTDNDSNLFNFDSQLDTQKFNRFSSHLSIRAPIKNSIVTYGSLQKVFRARFDENRSHSRLDDLSYSYTKQPFINSDRVSYESLLGKTKTNFFKNNIFKNNIKSFINDFYEISSGLNFYFYDFPFLIALKSDASKHIWFDWFAKWGMYETQPSSTSRYALYGMPYLSKAFEFSAANSEYLNETETYMLRIARARRNYITNWTHVPYFYARNKSWFKNNFFNEVVDQSTNRLVATKNLLNRSNWFWDNISVTDFSTFQFHPSNSGISSYNKMGWKPKHSIQSYYYSAANLIDILTKREYLYRELFLANNKLINLPIYLTNSTSNPLINEVKASFLFVDPIVLNNEYSRDVYYSSLNFFNFMVLKSFIKTFSEALNLNLVTDWLFYYFMNNDYSNALKFNSELYKSQYRPMRKGISNMIRLHATGAVAMPIEIRLQILASSKDVIHSWAIPSAGIKIDCVPGYSSHKVMIFLVSGIFWGQCMEICGRYHHWMPIVIYFMKRDLFFLWCTHFVFLSGANNAWNINDRQFANYVRLVSFDKYSWLTELTE